MRTKIIKQIIGGDECSVILSRVNAFDMLNFVQFMKRVNTISKEKRSLIDGKLIEQTNEATGNILKGTAIAYPSGQRVVINDWIDIDANLTAPEVNNLVMALTEYNTEFLANRPRLPRIKNDMGFTPMQYQTIDPMLGALINEGLCGLVDLRTTWDLEDAVIAHETLTIKKYNEHKAYKAASKK